MVPTALTIAGSDPSGGAGLQADLKTFHQHGVFGMSAVTLLTVQNTQSVAAVETLDPQFVRQQISAVCSDIPPAAIKTGALGNEAVMTAVAEEVAQCSCPLVVDPVMVSKHGDALIEAGAERCLRERLLPLAFLVTPNLHEAQRLVGQEIRNLAEMERAAAVIADLGPRHVLIKGGHLEEGGDVLLAAGKVHVYRNTPRFSRNLHGTGCVFAAAVTARLAAGEDVVAAVDGAKQFVLAGIDAAPGLGGGVGPISMHATIPPLRQGHGTT